MAFEKINLVYFSATGSTARVVAEIGNQIEAHEKQIYNLFSQPLDFISFGSDELTVFGVPVYAGRVPESARKAIEKIKGESTPAIVVCIYGNRDFDDALLELKDIVEQNGFHVISAAAFIAQHSIFPAIGLGRPDKQDLLKLSDFCKETMRLYPTKISEKSIQIRGNFPYRPIKPIPLRPITDSNCNSCGLCVSECPTGALAKKKEREPDKEKCISCAHCITVCPKKAKRFGGLLYWLVSRRFIRKFAERKEPYMVFRTLD
ncbi:MAG: EFR1 family ferrodoxin [Bacteroidales bacterium]